MKDKLPTLVVFDLDNTLYPYEECHSAGMTALLERLSSETGLHLARAAEAFKASRAVVKARLGNTATSHSRLLYVHEALAGLGFSSQPLLSLTLEQEYWRNYLLKMQLFPQVYELLVSLRFKKIPIALVTDLTLSIQIRKLGVLGIENLFDVVVASEEVTGDKVTLKPFELLVSRSDQGWWERVWFVGDRSTDFPPGQIGENVLLSPNEFLFFGPLDDRNRSGGALIGEVYRRFRSLENEGASLM